MKNSKIARQARAMERRKKELARWRTIKNQLPEISDPWGRDYFQGCMLSGDQLAEHIDEKIRRVAKELKPK